MSSAPDTVSPARALVTSSLRAIETEQPRAFDALLGTMQGHAVAFEIAAERFVLRFDAAGVRLDDGRVAVPPGTSSERAVPRIRCDYAVLRDLIDGDASLAGAMLAVRIGVFGRLADLDRLDRGFTLFLHGAVAAPSMPMHANEFSQATQRIERDVQLRQ